MKNIYLLSGEDTFRLALKFKELKTKILESLQIKELETLKPKEEEELISLAFSVSLFQKSKLILLDLNRIKAQELDDLVKELKKQALPKQVFLFFYKEGKLDKRLKSSKELEQLADQKFTLELFSPWKIKEIADWVRAIAQEKNLQIEPKAALKLADFYKSNTAQIAASLDLLNLYFEKDGEIINLELVEKLCKQEANIFLSIDLLLERDFNKFQESLKDLLLHQSPFQILAALQSIFDYFLDLKDLTENLKNSPDQAAKKIGKHPFKVKQDLLKLQKWSFQGIFEFYKELNRLESLSKSGQLQDLSQALRFLFAKAS